MSTRLTTGGTLIDRSKPVTFTFNGESLKGYQGDTLASALLANDRMMMGRSFKYHRPRGVVSSGTEEPNALFGIGQDGRFEPNQRATMLQDLHVAAQLLEERVRTGDPPVRRSGARAQVGR